MSKQSPEQQDLQAIDRALNAAPLPDTSEHLDRAIMQYAREHTPKPEASSNSWWMPATVSACLAGFALVILLPKNDEPLSVPVPETRVETRSLETIDEMRVPRPEPEPQLSAVADSSPREFTAASVEAGATAVVDTASDVEPNLAKKQSRTQAAELASLTPAKPPSEDSMVPSEYLQQLAKLRVREPSPAASAIAMDVPVSRAMLNESAVNAVKKRGNDVQQDVGDKAKTREQRYQQLREDCQCGLPETLEQALEALENGNYGAIPTITPSTEQNK